MLKDTHPATCSAVSEDASWRDYISELTAEQVAELESWEQQPDGGRGSDMRLKALVVAARSMSRQNRWQREYADVPAPRDATHVGDWHPYDDIETPARYFEGLRGPHVHVGGLQNSDGSVRERWISVTIDADDLDSARARALARFLLYAADELETAAFAEAVDQLRDIDTDEGVTYRDACRAGVAVVQADADAFGAVL